MVHNTLIELSEQLLALVKAAEANKDPNSKAAWDAKHRIALLCNDLKREALGPAEFTAVVAEACQDSAALHLISSLGIADIIGDGTASLKDIAQKTNVDELYLSIAMSNILGNGFFEEVGGFGTHVYKNNAQSYVLRSGHKDSMLEALGFICDEGAKSTAYMLEAAKAQDGKAPFNPAFGYEGTIFRFQAESPGSWRTERMGKAMQQLHKLSNANVITDFHWNKVASPVVDIGGGVGALEMALTEAYPESKLEFTIFDMPETAEKGTKVWSSRPASARARVSFKGGNFLANTLEGSGMPTGKPTYLIRHVLHDWTDDIAIAILKRIREAMLHSATNVSGARLLVCDMMLTADSSSFVRTTSMQLLALNKGKTRTEGEMLGLVKAAGFEIIAVHGMRAVDSIIEARPII